jgi:predicted enzyme related to lactoylglutathione lyase
MERAVGIGGVFTRTKDPGASARWYREVLGIDTYSDDVPEEERVWRQEAGPTVWSPFPADTDYFGRRDQQVMINIRVRNLDAMLDQVRAHGATVVGEVQSLDGIGRFGWIEDPDGNRIELWEPAPEAEGGPVS